MKLNQHYLEQAEKNTPPLYFETVTTDKTVRIVPDPDAFFGVRAVADGKAPAVVKKGDHFLLDFGRHCVGKFSMTVRDNGRYLDAPVRLKLKFGEVPYEMDRDFASYHGQLCASWLPEEIINVDQIGKVSLPRRYSFRYVEITVIATPRPTVLSDFSVLCETSADVSRLRPLPAGTDPELVEIDRVASNTLRDCMQTSYEDGPKRDRRLWSGDFRMQAMTDQVLFDNAMLARRCLYLFAACEQKDTYLPSCVYQYPEVRFDKEIDINDYAMLWCVALCEYFTHTKDRATADDLYPVLERQIDLACSLLDENGVIRQAGYWGGFLDWAKGLEHITGLHGVFLYTLKFVVPFARALGHPDAAARWEAALVRGKDAARRHLYDEKAHRFANKYDKFQHSVQATIWMILGDVLSDDEAKIALADAMNDPDAIQPLTPYCHQYLVEAMVKIGMRDEALAYLKSYWGAMVREGADTFWEVFAIGKPDLSPYGDPLMHSFCHAWSSSPSYFIRKYFV